MVNAVGLCRQVPKTMKLLRSLPGERPRAVQIFGHDPERLAEAASMLSDLGADIVDVNMGCPARKVVRHGSGSALLKDFSRIEAILRQVRKVVRGPLTVKTRAGWRAGEGEILDLAPLLADCGVDAVILHPRYGVQMFRGRADRDLIARLVERFPGPVIGNGDITRPQDAVDMMQKTGCAGVMIGRGAMGNPWIFSQTLALMHGRPITETDLPIRFQTAVRHIEMLAESEGKGRAVFMLRSIISWYTRGLTGATCFRRSINQERDFNRAMDLINHYFNGLIEAESKEAVAG